MGTHMSQLQDSSAVDDPTQAAQLPDKQSAETAQPRPRSRKVTKLTVDDYQPASASVPSQFLPNLDYIVVLDQGQEGSAVGNGIATMVDYLLRERGIND